MRNARDTIQNALYERIRAGLVPDYAKSVLRSLKDFPPGSGQQPAVVVAAGDEDATGSPTQPPMWNMRAHIFVAVWNIHGKGETTLLNVLDRIEVLMKRTNAEGTTDEGNDTTLGGLVHRAGIVGTIELYAGSTGEQALAIVPISMLVT